MHGHKREIPRGSNWSTMTEETCFSFEDDAPKKAPSDDRLNYAPFAERVADAIVRLDAPDGYVIGLHGKWGSGKSTVLNFVVDYLAQHNDAHEGDRVVSVEFRPWLITGHHDLIAAYFKVLAEALVSATSKRWWKRGPWLWFRKDSSRVLVDAATKLSLAVADPSGTTLLGTLALTAANTASQLSDRIRENPSLQKAYVELADKLRVGGRRFLVLIDDIDRLREDDVRSIMQMVKSVGQLPNVIYLLAYDREIVWNAFDRDATRTEPSFAEKIVQQELQLPVPSQPALLTILDEKISFLPDGIDQSLRWAHIVQDGLHRWIRTPRDVVRLSNALKFSWSALAGEIDPQDLLAMEGLRLFDFKVFEWLRDQRDYLFNEGRFQLVNDDLKNQTTAGLRHTVPEEKWSQIEPLVIQLFPKLAVDMGDTLSLGGLDSDEVQKRRGIGSEAGYDSYFGLYPSSDAIPLAVVNRLVSGGLDGEGIEACFRDFLESKNGRGDPLMEELLDELLIRFRGRQAAQPRQALLDALFAVGEAVIDIDYRPGLTGIHPREQLDALIREMLLRWGPGEAGPRLMDAVQNSDSPAFLADVYVSRGRELGVFTTDSRNSCPITQHEFDELGKILLTKIETTRNDGTLDEAPYYYSIARAWSHLATAREPKTWLKDGVVASDAFLAKTCLGLVSTLSGSSGRRIEMMRDPDPELYCIETLRAACVTHQHSVDLSGKERDLIAAVAKGCAKILQDKE